MFKKELAGKALMKAMQIRTEANVPLVDSVCVYDFAEASGIQEIRFVAIPTLEELYWKDERMLIISSMRPSGRQAYSCAHGYGHHVFGHGMCITSVDESDRCFEPNEFLAECFAGFLLMPKTAVSYGFAVRGWNIRMATPIQIHTIANWLGVGYETLIVHMRDTLRLLSGSESTDLLKVKPMSLRSKILGENVPGSLFIVDEHWKGRPLDISVGDFVLLGEGILFEGAELEAYKATYFGAIFRGIQPGCFGRLVNSSAGWSLPVRVSRADYVGRNIFRFDEDPDYER